MSNEDITAKELCELANQYQLSAEQIVNSCLRQAKNAAENQGRKQCQCSFNSNAVSDTELATVKERLEAKDITVSTSSNAEWLKISLDFSVC